MARIKGALATRKRRNKVLKLASIINEYSGNIKAKDIDGDTLSYSVSKLPVKGQITIDSNGNYSYIADGDKYGVDTFTIKIDDEFEKYKSQWKNLMEE